MDSSIPKPILHNTVGGVISALVILALGAGGNWVSGGGLLRLLNGVTQQKMNDHVHPVTHPIIEIQTGTLQATNVFMPPIPTDPHATRTFVGTVAFPRPFSTPPAVTLAMNRLDTERTANTRISLEVQSVSETGFNYAVHTWSDSQVYSVGASWLAVAR